MVKVQTNVAHRSVRTLTLDEFRGVDLTSSVLDTDKRRAVSMKNLLPEGGRNVKRRGWVQEFYMSGRIHGMWNFVRGDFSTLLVHAGAGLYESYEDGGEVKWRVVRGCTELLKDEDSEAFLFDGRMYLVGHAAYLVYGSWDGGVTYELRRVADGEDTYVPITTIAINPEGTTDAEGNVKDTRTSWDPVNRLSSKRRNRLLGRSLTDGDNGQITWRLDSVVDWYDNNERCDVTVEAEVKHGYSTVTYRLESRSHLVGVTFENDLVFAGNSAPEGFAVGDVGGKILGGGTDATRLMLFFGTPPPLESEDNMTVTFVKKTEGHAEAIGACRFGVLYGAGGNADRLFLAGNPDEPAVEYYSYWRDPTYFPDVYYNRVGSSYTDIVGFARVSDGVMAVFKERERQELTVYYHTATEKIVYDDNDNLERVDFLLTTQAGNIGEGMVSRRASVDFFGDPLILSQNGVFGIVMRSNVMTADRYAVERSRNIREGLRKHTDLSRAVGIVYENQYWLAVDGVCYVADEGYTFKPQEGSSGYQYEWWYLENVPAVTFAVMNDMLWFGTEDGRICRFRRRDEETKHLYVDERRRYISPWVSSETTWDVEALTVSEEDPARILASDAFFSKLGTADMDALVPGPTAYALYLNAEDFTVSDGRICLRDPNRVSEVHEGTVVYADRIPLDAGLAEETAYTILEIDRGEGSFGLSLDGSTAVEIAKDGFRLSLRLAGRELFIKDVDRAEGEFSLSLYEGGEALRFVAYGNTTEIDHLAGEHIMRDVVTAEWYSPFLAPGAVGYRKTLDRLTAVLEPSHSGPVSIGYETRTRESASTARELTGLDLGDVSFRKFTLSAFAGSQSFLCRERNINYIRFWAASNSPSDMRLQCLTVEYRITKANRGLV